MERGEINYTGTDYDWTILINKVLDKELSGLTFEDFIPAKKILVDDLNNLIRSFEIYLDFYVKKLS